MPELVEEEDYAEPDSSDNEEQYSRLLNSVSQLDSTQRVKPASRKEIISEASEFNLTKGTEVSQNRVNVNELAAALGKKTSHAAITKKVVKVTGKGKTLPKPLEKPVEERLKRSVGFEKVKNELRKWDSIVARNSLKDQIKFPLNKGSVKIHESSDFFGQFQSVTPLETEIAGILKQEIKPKEVEEKVEFPLTVEEMLEKRKEMANLRAKLSYSQAKAQRQSKIKSKKYHRIMKREKLRQQLKEFEILQKTDPEAALKKLSELDKSRAHERASLRHRNTGHWAKNLSVRAKYDVESRKVLAEQLKMSREITQKVHTLDNSDQEEEEESNKTQKTNENPLAKENSIPSDNPWSLDVSQDVSNFVSSYKKYWNEQNKDVNQKRQNEETVNQKLTKDETVSRNKETNKQLEVKSSAKDVIPNVPNQNGKHLESKKFNKKEAKKTEKVNNISEPKNLSNGTCLKKTPKKNKKGVSFDDDSPSSKKGKGAKKETENTPCINITPASGVWIVTPVAEERKVERRTGKKRKAVEIDDLFSQVDDRLKKKAEEKVKRIKKKLKRLEDMKENKGEKRKKREEFDLSLKNRDIVERPDMDVELSEEVNGEGSSETFAIGSNPIEISSNQPPPEIDPQSFIQVKPKRLNSHLPENIEGEDALDDDETQQKAIEEAFSGDDVTAEFKEMKEKEEQSNQVEIQTSLPGWGNWGGEGIKPAPKSSVKVKLPQRKDKKREDIIINENENPKIKEHLVKEVPHPFKSVEAFEATIRAPVGRDWIPETAHRKLIMKQVKTQLGAVIEPMDEDEIIKLKAKRKTPFKGKVKEKKEK